MSSGIDVSLPPADVGGAPPPGAGAPSAPGAAPAPAGGGGGQLMGQVTSLIDALLAAPPEEAAQALAALGEGVNQVLTTKFPDMAAEAGAGAPPGGSPAGGPPTAVPTGPGGTGVVPGGSSGPA